MPHRPAESPALPRPTAVSAWEDRARQCYADGDLEAAVGAWEQLHTLLLGSGDPIGAARAAAMVATHLLIDTGLMAPVRGWVRRAEGLLEGRGELPLHATLGAVHAYERFLCGDLAAARRHAERAVELGERHGVADAVVMAETARARVTLLDGHLEEGLARLEQVGARLMAGEAGPLMTGMMLCEVVCAAQGLWLHDVAQEWTDAMARWSRDGAVGSLHGRCRVHRAELLRVMGPGDAAEQEARGACDELRPWMRRELGWPLVELGTIRLRRGDLDGAEEALLEAQAHTWDPQPGLALVHLARGDVGRATDEIAAAVAHPAPLPSKEQPPSPELRLAPLLAAQAEIAAAAEQPQVADRAAARLREIAARYPSRFLAAAADLAGARAAQATGDLAVAGRLAARACGAYAELGAPYESARARVVLAEVHARAGRTAEAGLERQVAEAALRAYSAADPSPPAPEAAAGDPAVFALDGVLRLIRFAGTEARLPDLTGFRHLQRLVAEPGREFHVLDLAGAGSGVTREGVQSGLPVLDDQARAAYRRRLVEVEEDLEEAGRLNDRARVELAARDREYLLAELAGAVGLHGRVRTTGGTAERARTSVARAVRYALDRLADVHPLAADHLRAAVRTGTYCSYRPDPLAAVQWAVRLDRRP